MTVTSSNLTQYIKLIKTDNLAKAIDTGIILLIVDVKIPVSIPLSMALIMIIFQHLR